MDAESEVDALTRRSLCVVYNFTLLVAAVVFVYETLSVNDKLIPPDATVRSRRL